ncbi:hypothetical protein RGU70_11150 [Herbaspirillum sp. RTI4]|uniref:hypothetical protein n=1 Tax=Herbaspirillum sp. RTI4 TaxID=3048640 RepID=UPI002AB42D0E|nr:hypothetical protein [Herbaspirillum sp. RTI4]MDY7578876.1 hypothetical protein [Herbaspirillum sp. RTI4]
MKIKNFDDEFYVVPVIKFGGGVRSGCYIQKLNSRFELEEFIPVAIVEGEACYGIISIYACNNKKYTGIGVISDMKFGANNYHPQGAFLDVDVVSQVRLNSELSAMLEVTPTASDAKKILNCDK